MGKRVSILFLFFIVVGCTNYNPKICLIVGDSTIANFKNYSSVAYYMRSDTSINKDFYICDISHSGDRISRQQRKWLSLKDKKQIDIVFIQVGLNDLYPPKTAQEIISEYQCFIDIIRQTGSEHIKIVAATMIPCKSFWMTKMGDSLGEVSFNKWVALNNAIMGRGTASLGDIDHRIEQHAIIMNNGSDDLKPAFRTSDLLHQNDKGRAIIAQEYAKALTHIYNTHNSQTH